MIQNFFRTEVHCIMPAGRTGSSDGEIVVNRSFSSRISSFRKGRVLLLLQLQAFQWLNYNKNISFFMLENYNGIEIFNEK